MTNDGGRPLMGTPLGPEDRLVQYLLGRLPETERVELEARLFRDEDLDEELLATSEDLIRAYLAGELPEEDRSQFESHFLASPENREQLELMRDVLAAVERVSEDAISTVESHPAAPMPRFRRFSHLTLAVAAAVVFAIGLAVVMTRRGRHDTREQATASPAPTVSATAKTTPESPMPRVAPPTPVSVVRLAGKAGGPADVHLAPSTRAVRAEVTVNAESLSFDAAVLDARGTVVWRAEGLAPPAAGRPLVLEVPAEVLDADRYTLRVEGESLRAAAAPILEFRLRVVRER